MSVIAPPPGTPVVVSPLSTLLATAYTQQPRINISASVCVPWSAAGPSPGSCALLPGLPDSALVESWQLVPKQPGLI